MLLIKFKLISCLHIRHEAEPGVSSQKPWLVRREPWITSWKLLLVLPLANRVVLPRSLISLGCWFPQLYDQGVECVAHLVPQVNFISYSLTWIFLNRWRIKMVQNLKTWKSPFPGLFPNPVVAFYTGNQRSDFFSFLQGSNTHVHAIVSAISAPPCFKEMRASRTHCFFPSLHFEDYFSTWVYFISRWEPVK